MKLQGKVAIVTGGAMGNGLGIVKSFLNEGASVVILDYSNTLPNVVTEFKNQGIDILAYQVDIRNEQMVNACVNQVKEKYGHIDILVNNAGVCKLEPFQLMTDEVRDFHFDINIKGTWNVTKACLPYLKEKGGSIVNLSSVTGVSVADSGEVAYATTKAAILGFTKSLAVELASSRIRVNAILPGYIYTPMVDNMAKLSNPTNPGEVIDGIAKAIPMKRLGAIEEVGALATFLASDDSSYITGEGIVISGGSTLRETLTMGI